MAPDPKTFEDAIAALQSLQNQHANAVTEHSKLEQKFKKLETNFQSLQANNIRYDSSFKVPIFQPGIMTADSFIDEVEKFLTMKGIDVAQWINLVGSLFADGSDHQTWMRAKRSSLKTWNDFVLAFKKYENCDGVNDLLQQSLYLKKQKLHEPFESYAWDVYMLYSKVHSKVDNKAIIERILNSCLTEVASELLPLKCTSVEDLVCSARLIIANLNKIRMRQKLPLFRARKTDPVHQYSNTPNHSPPAQNAASPKTEQNSAGIVAGNSKQAISCKYCKKIGHKVENCYKKQNADKRNLINELLDGPSTNPFKNQGN